MKALEKTLMLMLSASLFSSCQRSEGHSSLYDWMKLNTSLSYNNEIELDDDSLIWIKQITHEVRWQMELARVALNYSAIRDEAKTLFNTYAHLLADLENLALENHALLDESLEPEQQVQIERLKNLKGTALVNTLHREMQHSHKRVMGLLNSASGLRKNSICKLALKYLEQMEAKPFRQIFKTPAS